MDENKGKKVNKGKNNFKQHTVEEKNEMKSDFLQRTDNNKNIEDKIEEQKIIEQSKHGGNIPEEPGVDQCEKSYEKNEKKIEKDSKIVSEKDKKVEDKDISKKIVMDKVTDELEIDDETIEKLKNKIDNKEIKTIDEKKLNYIVLLKNRKFTRLKLETQLRMMDFNQKDIKLILSFTRKIDTNNIKLQDENNSVKKQDKADLMNPEKSDKTYVKSIEHFKKEIKELEQSFRPILNKLDDIVSHMGGPFETIKFELQSIQKKMENILPSRTTHIEDSNFNDQISMIKEEIKNNNELLELFNRDFSQKLKSIHNSFDIFHQKFDLLEKTFTDKNITIRQELPPSTEEDEIILNISIYGQKILEQLTLAARHYARNRQNIEDFNQERVKYEKDKKDYFERGKIEGKNLMIKDLTEKFDNLDNLLESEKPNDKILSSFLLNNGLVRDNKLFKSNSLQINEDNRIYYESKARFEGLGTFNIKKSCFYVKDEIICKAELEK